MSEVVTFGEAMIRLTPQNYSRLEQAQVLDMRVGGGELNVACNLRRLGVNSAWVSRLPLNPLGRVIANKAREQGVDTSGVVWTKEGRAGLYFVEFGAMPRPSEVMYDRAGSAMSLLRPGEIKWPDIFKGVKVFHTSGITPAISDSCAAATEEALTEAKKAGCKISYDLNYRARLWSQEKAREVQAKFMDKVNLLISTVEDADRVFGLGGTPEESAHKLQDKFGFPVVAITRRHEKTAWTGGWASWTLSKGKFIRSREYDVEVVDRVGSGDSFAAGLLCGYLAGDLEKGVAYGDAMAALKNTMPGDFSWATKEEVERLIASADMRIQR
jgi:2-dehydro-3-deoxygluconokinase